MGEAGGYRTRTSALTGGGASAGVATSVMALGSRRGGVSPGDVSPGEKPLTSRVPEHVVFCQNEICMHDDVLSVRKDLSGPRKTASRTAACSALEIRFLVREDLRVKGETLRVWP